MALVPASKFCHPVGMSTRYRIVQGFLVCLTLGLGLPAGAADDLAGVSEESYADFMGNEVLDLQDLAEGAEIQRRMFNRITPSGFSWLQPMFPSVAPFEAKYFDEAFLDSLLGEETNSVAVYPLSLVLDPKTRETLIYNAEGELITSVPPDGVSRAWPEDADPSRVTLTLDLIPVEDAEQFLYAEDRIAGTLATSASKSAKTPKTGGVVAMNMMVGSTNFGILDFQRLTNGNFRLTVTNGTEVAEVYSYTVWHTSSVDVATWTNEESNVVTSTNIIWTPTSPPFNGLESDWDFGTTNLALTNGMGAWEDSNISSNARVRFYGAAESADADHDGLTDGAELFVYHTSPTNRDTDADGWSDAEELVEETDPLDRFSATRLAKGVVINEVMYDASGTDIYKEWIELYSAGRYPVDLGGFVIQVGDLSFTNAYVFPSNTWIDPGTYLLLGGSQVTNRDVQVDFTMPNRFTNDATAAVRLVAESGTNILVADCLMYGGNAGNFNSNGLDTTGWISTTARSAGGGNSLYRLFAGHDTDQVLDWQWTSSPTTNSAAETPDTDGDGLSDQTELTGSSNVWGEATNPLHADTDGDGLGDYDECIAHGTDPNTWATDGDIFPWPPTNNVASNWWGSDSYELNNGWNPLVYDENTNGIPDSWEMAFPGTNLYADADDDDISNFDELMQNSNPYDNAATNAQPYIVRFESSKPGWINNGLVDVGLSGWVKIYFAGLKADTDLCVWVKECSTQEEFKVEWFDAAHNGTTWLNEGREAFTCASALADSRPYLLVQDLGWHPDFISTLGGEYSNTVYEIDIATDINNDGVVNAVDDPVEESGIGEIVRVDDDLDPTAGEDDMQYMKVKVEPVLAQGVVWFTYDTNIVSMWEDLEKTQPIPPGSDTSPTWDLSADSLPDHVFVEGITTTVENASIKLVLHLKLGDAECTDTILFTVTDQVGHYAYFMGAKDYIVENDTEVFLDDVFVSGGFADVADFVMVGVRADKAELTVADSKTPDLADIGQVMDAYPNSHIIANGTFYHLAGGLLPSYGPWTYGRVIEGGSALPISSNTPYSITYRGWFAQNTDNSFSWARGSEPSLGSPTKSAIGGMAAFIPGGYASSYLDIVNAINADNPSQFTSALSHLGLANENDEGILFLLYINDDAPASQAFPTSVDRAGDLFPKLALSGTSVLFGLDGGGSIGVAHVDIDGALDVKVRSWRQKWWLPTPDKVNNYIVITVSP